MTPFVAWCSATYTNDRPPLSVALKKCWEAATKAEREACAKLCEAADKSAHPADLAYEIRKRGEGE
jgi:hypothetical protein